MNFCARHRAPPADLARERLLTFPVVLLFLLQKTTNSIQRHTAVNSKNLVIACKLAALAVGFSVAPLNRAEFDRVPGLTVIDESRFVLRPVKEC